MNYLKSGLTLLTQVKNTELGKFSFLSFSCLVGVEASEGKQITEREIRVDMLFMPLNCSGSEHVFLLNLSTCECDEVPNSSNSRKPQIKICLSVSVTVFCNRVRIGNMGTI